jgi:predicted PurR-regulated permease PerM
VRILDRYMPRGIAVAITLLTAAGIIALTFTLAIPPLAAEVTDFVEDAPSIIEDAESRVTDFVARMESEGLLPSDAEERLTEYQNELQARAGSSIGPVLTGILGQVTGVIGLFITLFGVLFVGITLLADGDRLRRQVTKAFPQRYHDDLDEMWSDLGSSLSRYLGGLIVIAIVQGVLISIGLLFLGIPYALVLGLWVAATSVVPFIGAWLGAIPALILALLGNPTDAIWVALLYLIVQTLEGNVLTPRVQGDAVRVHPIIVLLTVIAVGSLFGIIGVILAVPSLAVGRVLFDFFRARLRFEDRAPTDHSTDEIV